MWKFKIGAIIGFAAGWAVGSGQAAEVWRRMTSKDRTGLSGAVVSRVERPVFEREPEVSDGATTAVGG